MAKIEQDEEEIWQERNYKSRSKETNKISIVSKLKANTHIISDATKKINNLLFEDFVNGVGY